MGFQGPDNIRPAPFFQGDPHFPHDIKAASHAFRGQGLGQAQDSLVRPRICVILCIKAE